MAGGRVRDRQKYETLGSDKINCFNGRFSERATFPCAIQQPVSLSWGFLGRYWLIPDPHRKRGHYSDTMFSPSRDPEVCLNIRRLG